MQPMAFYKTSFFNTTTMAVVDSVNTLTVIKSFDRNPSTQWQTIGYGTNTSTIFSIDFQTSTSISKIYLQNHNLKQFRIFYNSSTANTFTPAINYTTNSETSNYFSFSTITVNTIQIQCDLAMTTDTEKKIGDIYAGDTMLQFERNPSSSNYNPLNSRTKVVHRMPNGGVSIFVVDKKFKTELAWEHLSESFTSQLLNVYETNTSFVFIPFATTSSWNGRAYECAWTSNFDFKHSNNVTSAGYGGKIVIEEVA